MLTDEQIRKIFMANGFTVKPGLTDLKAYVYEAARAIESAACADRDARIAQLEQRNRDLYEDVRRFKEYALSEKDARLVLERELAEARKDAERFAAFASGEANIMQSMIATICKQQPTDLEWWRTAIDAAMKKENS